MKWENNFLFWKLDVLSLNINLTNSNESRGINTKISDGSVYLKVDFADDVRTSLIGFSLPEMNMLKKIPFHMQSLSMV